MLDRANETYTIEELHPYNAWQLHTIHAQKGHGYMQLLLGFASQGHSI